jgi:hypothetical protein
MEESSAPQPEYRSFHFVSRECETDGRHILVVLAPFCKVQLKFVIEDASKIILTSFPGRSVRGEPSRKAIPRRLRYPHRAGPVGSYISAYAQDRGGGFLGECPFDLPLFMAARFVLCARPSRLRGHGRRASPRFTAVAAPTGHHPS